MLFVSFKRFFKLVPYALFTAVFLSVMPSYVHAEAGALKPQASIDEFLNTLRSMQFPVTDEAVHSEKVARADSFLDLDLLGQKSIAGYWDQATAAERIKFLKLFTQLIEKVAYQKSNEFLGSFGVTYPSQEEDGSGVLVTSIVEQEDASLNAEVVYHLYSKEDHWVIDDVVLDGVSIVEDLQYQFEKLIKDSGFTGLLEKMQTRLDEAAAENTGTHS